MRLSGRGHNFEPTDAYEITEAIVTDTRLSLDFIEDGTHGHLEAHSEDGKRYKGCYRYPSLEPDAYPAEFEVFRANDGEVLLVGRWWDRRNGETGDWMLRPQ